MSKSGKGGKVPLELPKTARTQSPSCFLHCVILRAYIGEQAAYIYSCLHSQRKLTLSQLSSKSGIKGSNLKKVLVTLIQLGCVVYVTERNGQVFYSHNEEGCWKLTYTDEIVRHVREKFGQVHAGVIQNVMLRGHLTIGSYVKELDVKSEVDKIEQAFFDLVEDQWLVNVKELDFKPLSESFNECMVYANREFLNNNAQYLKGDEMGGGGGGGNPRFKSVGLSQMKKTLIIKDLAKEKFMKIYFDSNGKDRLYKVGSNNQSGDDYTNVGSKTDEMKVAKGLSTLFSDDEDEEDDVGGVDGNSKKNGFRLLRRLNGHVPLTVSFDRFLKYERDLQLVSIAKHRIGNVSAMIYKVALNRIQKSSREVRSIEDIVDKLVADASVGAGGAGTSTAGYDPNVGKDLMKRLELKDQEKGMNFGAADILKELSISNKHDLTKDDLIGTIDNEDADEYENNSKKRKLEEDRKNGSLKKTKLSKLASQIKTFDEDEDEEEDKEIDNGFDLNDSSGTGELMMLILQHLKLLTTDKKLSFLVETTPGQFYIPFTVLQSQTPYYQMKQIVRNILGNSALRILNCIEDKRLIEEKNIAKSVLMREGTVRKVIATLTKFGLVEIQEVPRTADRNAMRSIFAFKINRNHLRSRRILGKCLMFNMGESLDQLESFKKENKILLDKISREDVRGREIELLTESELKQLKAIMENEKIGMAKFQRLRILGESLWFTETV